MERARLDSRRHLNQDHIPELNDGVGFGQPKQHFNSKTVSTRIWDQSQLEQQHINTIRDDDDGRKIIRHLDQDQILNLNDGQGLGLGFVQQQQQQQQKNHLKTVTPRPWDQTLIAQQQPSISRDDADRKIKTKVGLTLIC